MESATNRDGTRSDEERVTVLTFDLEEKRYCVRAEVVATVLGVADDSPLANADDPWDAGTITVTGEPVRVIDLPRVFGSSFQTSARVDDPKLLVFSVTDGDGRYYGWLVDDVDVARTVRTASIKPPQMNTTQVEGRLEIDGEEVVWLDEQAVHA